MDNKTIHKFILLLIISAILLAFNGYKNLPNVKLRKHIINRGFTLEPDQTFYYKKISDKSISEYEYDKTNNISSNYDYLYFDIYNKKLNEEINDYNDKYETSLNINYKFSNYKLNYYFRINYDNDKNIIFKGNYDEEKDVFTCKKLFAHNINIDENKKYFCGYVNGYVESFIIIKNKLFPERIVNKYLR